MAQAGFTPQDKLQYVMNADHYRPASSMRHVRRRMGNLKIYVILIILAIGGGAAAVYLPALLAPAEGSGFDLSKMKDPAELMEKVKNNPELLEQLKRQYGR